MPVLPSYKNQSIDWATLAFNGLKGIYCFPPFSNIQSKFSCLEILYKIPFYLKIEKTFGQQNGKAFLMISFLMISFLDIYVPFDPDVVQSIKWRHV